MRKKIMVAVCFLLFAMPGLSFAENKKQPNPNVSAYEHANENAKFKRTRALFHSKVHKEIRAKRAKRLAEKKAAEEKKKAEEDQTKGEGQVRVEF